MKNESQQRFTGFLALLGAVITALMGVSLLFIVTTVGGSARTTIGTVIMISFLLGISVYLMLKARTFLAGLNPSGPQHIPARQWKFIGAIGIAAGLWDLISQARWAKSAAQTTGSLLRIFAPSILLIALSLFCLSLAFRKHQKNRSDPL
jgi:cbb3-type cytochrome oxidase subunit 3